MIFKVLTLFPEMYNEFINTSIIGRAIEKEKISIEVINIRDYSLNKHKSVDDAPYGGGAGMVMTIQPIVDALKANQSEEAYNIFLSPKAKPLNQSKVKRLSQKKEIILLCGHYEGVDQRVIENYIDEEISIGDYVLTGGELASMVLMDSIIRLLPGVIGDSESYKKDSYYNGLLDHPQYTRPSSYKGLEVPKVLLSGNHKKIEQWRLEEAIKSTIDKRPDLIEKILETDAENEITKIIKKICNDK